MPSSTRRLVVATLGAAATAGTLLLGIVATAPPAAAHTQLIGTNPAANATLTASPSTVELTFNQNVQTTFAQVAVLDAAQGHLESGAPSVVGAVVSQPVAALPSGAYTVSWRVVSADGHPVSGTYAFTVALPAPSPTSTPIAESAAPTSAPEPTEEPSADQTASPAAEDDDSGLPAWAMTGLALGAAGAVGAIAFRLTRGPRNPSE